MMRRMAVDSLLLMSAFVLFGACVAGWRMAAALRAPARMPLRFAVLLLAALAVAAMLGLGDVTALLLLPLAGTGLALAALARFARPLHVAMTSLLFVAALACGLGAMLSDAWMLALAPLACAALAIVAASLNGMAPVAALAGASLLAAGLSILQNGVTAGTLLFSAASVMGFVTGMKARSALAVHQQRPAGFGAGIGRVRHRAVLTALRHELAQDLRHK
jgi:hypothetical protein